MLHEFFLFEFGVTVSCFEQMQASYYLFSFSDTCRLEGKNQNKTEKRKEPLNFPPLAADPRWAGIQCVVGKVLVLGKTSAVPCAAQQMARVCWWFSSKAIELLDAVRRAQLLSGTGAGNRYFLVRKGQRAGADVLG